MSRSSANHFHSKVRSKILERSIFLGCLLHLCRHKGTKKRTEGEDKNHEETRMFPTGDEGDGRSLVKNTGDTCSERCIQVSNG